MRSIRRDARGATAIEYAVIAALIGIGLVGSLVATRGSLSAIFGTASSQMASGTAASGQPASTSPRAAFWAGKTLATAPVTTQSGGSSSTLYKYTDGTQVTLGRNPMPTSNPTTLQVVDPVNRVRLYSWADPAGVQNYFQYTMTDAAMNPRYVVSSNSDQMTNGVPTKTTVTNVASQSTAYNQDPEAYYLTAAQAEANDIRYFSDISP